MAVVTLCLAPGRGRPEGQAVLGETVMDGLLRATGGRETGAGRLHPGGGLSARLTAIGMSLAEPLMQAKVLKLAPVFGKPGPVFTKPGPAISKLALVVRKPLLIVRKPAAVFTKPASKVRKPAPGMRLPPPAVRLPGSILRKPGVKVLPSG